MIATIGQYSSWAATACKNGHALTVPTDDLIDKMTKEGGTFTEFERAVALRGLEATCETCAEEAPER